MIIAYASRTGTKRNLRGLARAGWRLMVSAKGVVRTEGMTYALDNGAWWAFQNKQPFDTKAFLFAYEKLGAGADFVVLPDMVGAGNASLEFSLRWKDRLGDPLCPQMLAVQDGMDFDEAERLAKAYGLGIFLGGTTEWKLATMAQWGKVASRIGVPFHVGRVNSAKRIALCLAFGATSFDGSNASRFSVNLAKLDLSRHQMPLPLVG